VAIPGAVLCPLSGPLWLLSLGIVGTLAANVAHGLGHGPVGAAVGAWPAVAPVGSYELLMVIIRARDRQRNRRTSPWQGPCPLRRRTRSRPKRLRSSPAT
jgi:hypothetical protein